MDSDLAIGIDLGTTNTCVAVVKNCEVNVITNEQGSRTFPSVVSFTEDGTQVGHIAKHGMHDYTKNVIFDVKRIIGSRFADVSTQNDIKQWPFDIIDVGGNPAILVEQNGVSTSYYPEQISAMVLKYAKTLAEERMGCTITEAVITVPAYFNNSQRRATKDAASIAGLEVLRIINEPTAAAIAYGWENKSFVDRTVLVYDLGGGTFDVSIVKIVNDDYTVLATLGDTHLGGGDFDAKLVEFLAKEFEAKNGLNLRKDKYAMRRLRSKCEEAKEKLSFGELQTTVELARIHKGIDLNVKICRVQFEQLNHDLFQRTIDIVDTCLKDVKMNKGEITDIVLVGGSTRIPKIQEMLKLYFDNRNLMKSINPDEAVAYGAAIQAAILTENKNDKMADDMKISDVTPLSLGKSIYSGEMVTLIKRNSPIPCTATKDFYTIEDNQTSVEKYIYQGERKLAKENVLLGTFRIENLPKRPAGKVKFLDTFSLDEDGILHVDSVVDGTGLKGNVVIRLEENRLSVSEIQRLIELAEQKAKEDMKKIRLKEAEYALESYCLTTGTKARQDSHGLSPENRSKIISVCENSVVKMKQIGGDALEMQALLDEVKRICEPLLK